MRAQADRTAIEITSEAERDAQIIRGEPGPTPDRSVAWLIGAYRVPEKHAESRAAFEFGLRAFQTEDLPAAEESQRGLAAGRQTLLIGRNEPVVQFWHRLWRYSLDGRKTLDD